MAQRKWPVWARILVVLVLVPVWAAAILAAENDLSEIGAWFDPLMIGLMLLTVITAWIATQHSQR
jgi:ABC-type sulfate transport system permease component